MNTIIYQIDGKVFDTVIRSGLVTSFIKKHLSDAKILGVYVGVNQYIQ